MQFCRTLSRLCEKVDRASIIVQTKVPPKEDPEDFRVALQRSFDTLQPPGGYIDLFGFHGINHEKQLEWTKNCMAVAKEYQVRQRRFNPLFLGRFSAVFRRFSAVSFFPRHLASWRQDGENALKIAGFG